MFQTGGEYTLPETRFNLDRIKNGAICQLMIELHYYGGSFETWTSLVRKIQEVGFRMFYKEANHYCAQCHEYSFIHRACSGFYGVPDETLFLY